MIEHNVLVLWPHFDDSWRVGISTRHITVSIVQPLPQRKGKLVSSIDTNDGLVVLFILKNEYE